MNAHAEVTPVEAAAYAEYGELLRDPWWRVTSGHLYRIIDKDGQDVAFLPNDEQIEFLSGLWYRNAIPKARQLGFTTSAIIYFLDHALWNPNQSCGMVSYDRASQEVAFRKARYAYDNLPEYLKPYLPLKKATEQELMFSNGSSLRIALTMRGGTLQRLHVSELARMGKVYPKRAREVLEGSMKAVAPTGVIIVESTSEGPAGPFYDIAHRAQEIHEAGRQLTQLDYRFFFFPWWKKRSNRIDPTHAVISPRDHEYFASIEQIMGCEIDLWQRAWYVTIRDSEHGGDQEVMWREQPSTPDECWQKSTEGKWFSRQLMRARADGRIRKLPLLPHVPVDTFWDIGHADGTAIWLMQHVHPEYRMIRFVEGWEEQYDFFIRELERGNHIWGTHYLPHDAEAERQGAYEPYSPLSELRKLKPTWNFRIVPRVGELIHGINALRDVFPQIWFDEEWCKEGLDHLALYSKRWVSQTQTYADEPVKHDGHSEAADALRQFAQVFESLNPSVRAGQRPNRQGRKSV